MLSRRELDVAQHYAQGQSYKEIARDLDVSPSTMRNHLASIYRKLEINNKAQLINCLNQTSQSDMEVRSFEPGTVASSALQILDSTRHKALAQPSVAVLPFQNIGSPDREYFCQGVSLNVHNNLTRFPDMFVSGRGSCLAVNHLIEDLAEVGRAIPCSRRGKN